MLGKSANDGWCGEGEKGRQNGLRWWQVGGDARVQCTSQIWLC